MNKLIRLCVVGLVSIAIASCTEPAEDVASDSTSETSSSSIETAQELEMLNKQIVKDPNNLALYHSRALYYYNNRNLGPALKDMERILAKDSTVAEFHAAIANIHYAMRKFGMARDAFEKCVSYDPKYIDALLKLSEIHFLIKDYETAMEYLDKTLKVDELEERAYYQKGFVFMEIGDTAKSVSSFRTATELNPDFYDAYMQLARLFASAHMPETIDYYNNALKVRPSSIEALYNKGMFCQEHEQYELALNCYNTMLLVDSTHPGAYYNIGYINLEYLQVYDEAVNYFTRAITAKPNYANAWYNRGYSFEKLGKIEKAETDYRYALQIEPAHDLAARGLSRILDN